MTTLEKPPRSSQFFYQSDHLCSSTGSSTERLIMAQSVAVGQHSSNLSVQLFHLDSAKSVIGSSTVRFAYRYTPYGGSRGALASLMASFVAQRFDKMSNGYPLGNGLRVYKPGIFRFGSPDRLSPFGKGGLNPYSYCQGDPVNKHDPSGQFPILHYLLRAAVRSAVAVTRHLGRATEVMTLTIEEVVRETVRDVVRQLTPVLEIGHDVIAAAAAVPTELSMRADALDRQPQIPIGRPSRSEALSLHSQVEQNTVVRRQ